MDKTTIGKERGNSYWKKCFLKVDPKGWIYGIVGGGPMTIHSCGQTSGTFPNLSHGTVFTMCSHTFTLFWLRKTSVINNLREKFSPWPGFKPGSPALCAGTLINWATQTIHWAKLEFFNFGKSLPFLFQFFWVYTSVLYFPHGLN